MSSSRTGSSSPCAERISAIHTALPPDPVITATRLPRGSRQNEEAVGATYPFEIEKENLGATLVEPPIDVVVGLQDSLVAGADLMRKVELPIAAAAEKREGQRAALTADRDRPCFADGRQQTLAGVVEDRAESG